MRVAARGDTFLVTKTDGTPTSTDFVEVSDKRLKVKPLPEAPKIPQLSNVAVILILKKLWDQFRPVFPTDGYGIQESMDTTVTVSGTSIAFERDKQYDAFAASSQFIKTAIPLVHALYERPQIKALIKKFGGENQGDNIDVMKVIYGYLGGGFAGRRYLNRKYFYDLLNDKMFKKLNEEVKYGPLTGKPEELLKDAAALYQKERQAYNASKTYDSEVLAKWVGSNDAEKQLYDTMLALTSQTDDLTALGMKVLADVVREKAKQKLSNLFSLNGLGVVTRKMKPEKAWDETYGKAQGKAYATALKIDAATTQLRTATQNFNGSYSQSRPPFDGVPKITWGGSTFGIAYAPPPILPGIPQTGLAGLMDMDISSAVFKASALGMVGYAVAKKKPLLGILAGVLTFAAFKDVFDAPKVASAPQLPVYRPIVRMPIPIQQQVQTLGCGDEFECEDEFSA